MRPGTKTIITSAGKIACRDTEKDAQAVLFIHGNSACKEAFSPQFESSLLQDYRLVAIDLPGHGQSDDISDVAAKCTIPSLARLVGEVIDILGLKDTILTGWSFGGHIGIEMVGQGVDIKGLILTGTPPCGPGADDIGAAFIPSPHMALTGKAEFTDAEARTYAHHIYGPTVTEKLIQNVNRTQGAVRAAVLGNFMVERSAHRQKQVVATTSVPIAVLQGEDDSFMSLDYFDSLTWNSLWRNRVAVIRGAGHAPFREKPAEYNRLLSQFIKDQRLR